MIKVNEQQYTKLLHEKMQEHEMYKEGMSVEAIPPSSEKPSGYSVTGGVDAITIMTWAAKELEEQYIVEITHC